VDGVQVQDLPATAPYTWGVLGTDLPVATVTDLEYDPSDNVLMATTLGRGAYRFFPEGDCGGDRLDTLLLNNQKVTTSTAFEACDTIVAGDNFSIEGAGTEVSFNPGEGVVLIPGLKVIDGAVFKVNTSAIFP